MNEYIWPIHEEEIRTQLSKSGIIPAILETYQTEIAGTIFMDEEDRIKFISRDGRNCILEKGNIIYLE